jgi:sugar/nucleoside kinase (ribokinase family)
VGNEQMSFSWNPGSKELELLAVGKLPLPKVNKGVFVVNREEWRMVEKLQSEIKKQFYLVVVTAGRHGGEVYEQGKLPTHYETLQAGKVVDETGAGDAFCSGLVGALLEGRSVELAVRMGKTAAARVVTKIGGKAGLPKRKPSAPAPK